MTGGRQSARRVRVAVVFGGRSAEHGVSCLTAGSVLAALDPARYEVLAVGITTEGRWVLAPAGATRLEITDGGLPNVAGEGAGLALAGDPGVRGLVPLDGADRAARLAEVDVVFPLLHGPFGEDGTVQGLLELAGLPYVGSGVLASAAAMDKEYMKLLLAARGLPVGRFLVVPPGDWPDRRERVLDQVARLGLPVFVKPARGGSSLGIAKVTSTAGVSDAIDGAFGYDPKVLVEAAVAGREVECGVLQDLSGAAQASVPAEVRVSGGHQFYDFDAKYLDQATDFDVPAHLSAALTVQVRSLATRAFAALGCEGLARVDFFLPPDGGLLVNEVNTMPGFTPASMFPRMWAATGLDYPALVDRLIQLALHRRTGLR